ncbi:hypothetical protein [Croceimicrobium sp.]|uniref:hypothetical protein n=1 Tax=Croceimicrobium sp. TaxID=2828340 RepID=UPI003BAA2323
MRRLCFIAISLSIGNLGAQDFHSRIEEHVIQESLFNGQIGDYPIRMYLQIVATEDRMHPYTVVEGWYSYNSVGTAIPIFGLQSGQQLLLFSGDAYMDSIREIAYPELDFVDGYPDLMDPWPILSSEEFDFFGERFHFTQDNAYWQKGAKKEELRLSFDPSQLYRSFRHLVWDDGRAMDLEAMGLVGSGYSVLAENEYSVLLHYIYDSNPWNPMGRCGAGFETGLYLIHFSVEGFFLKADHYALESCNAGTYIEYSLEEDGRLKLESMHDEGQEDLFIDLNVFDQSPGSIVKAMQRETY